MPLQTGGQIIDLQSGSSTRALNGKYRRNGKLQSCEPCRKSKLRCDHVVPTCNRCVRRKCADKCVYHPNPLTKSRQTAEEEPLTPSTTTTIATGETPPVPVPSVESPDPSPPAQTSTVVPRSARRKQASSQAQAQAQQVPPQLSRAASEPPLPSHQCNGGPPRVNPGFFGATNFMSIFTENLGKLGVVSTGLEGPDLPRLTISSDQVDRGAHILSFLKDSTLVHDFINRFFDIGEGAASICIEPIMKQWLLKLWANHTDTLKKRNPERLRRLSELLWRNTLSPISVQPDMDYKTWALQATGMNIRWEVIGLIAALIGQCANTLSRSDLLLAQHNVSKPVLARKMNEISSTCLNFARDCEALDDLFIWLVIENLDLTTSLKGDGSYAAYRESGEYVNAVVAMGLHNDVRQEKQRIPFFLEQTRRRAVAGAYCSDISISSYLGRPPRLPARYCNLVPPLDIPDVQLVADDDQISRIIASLDENGFGSAGKVSRATWLRTWLSFAIKREEILDLALGRYSREEILRRCEEIQEQTQEHMASLPPFIRSIALDPFDFSEGSSKRRPIETMLRLTLRQGYQANELLLQRVRIRKTGASWDKLVQTALVNFEDILQVSRRHDLASIFQNDISALLAVQGLRSAAVIAVELLKQEQLPNYPKNPVLSRSRTIQDLSVFASRLGDVDPLDGWFTMCEQGRKVITRILDKILSPPERSTTSQMQQHQQQQQQRQQQYQHPQQQQQQQQQHEQQTFALHAGPSMDMNLFHTEPTPQHQNQAHQQQEWGMADHTLDFQLGDPSWGVGLPFLGHDNDFMQWLEHMDWERPPI
ncbi:hypothetical protein F5Y17DRAFT_464304 [Xylariaceae sp. FL0594]|nr:hypothetical protein F5Y17DRAFT_464304 [Xylariaceae sp. FL0594]